MVVGLVIRGRRRDDVEVVAVFVYGGLLGACICLPIV